MTNDKIKSIAFDCGFTLRKQPDGSMDLDPYVYAFAQALRTEVIAEIRTLVTQLETAIGGNITKLY